MKRWTAWMLAILTAFIFLLPLLWMLHASLRPETRVFTGGMVSIFNLTGLSLENYADAWRRAHMGRALINSVLQLAGIVGLGLFINSLAAFAFARLEFPGRHVLFTVVVVLIILPVQVLVIPLFLTVRQIGLSGGYPATMGALILPFAAQAFNIYFLRQHFLQLPGELEEAALIDGAGWFRIYWHLALPAIRPALATVIVLDVLTHWSAFIWPLVICTREGTRTIQISMSNLFTQPPIQWGDILAGAVIATLPVMLIFHYAQRYLVLTESRAGIK